MEDIARRVGLLTFCVTVVYGFTASGNDICQDLDSKYYEFDSIKLKPGCLKRFDCATAEKCCPGNDAAFCHHDNFYGHQTCDYNGTSHHVDTIFKGAKGEFCRCGAGYRHGELRCGFLPYPEREEMCSSSYVQGNATEEELPAEYSYPYMANCPSDRELVAVYVRSDQNWAPLTHQFVVRDWKGRPLNYDVRQKDYYICNCTHQPLYENVAISEPDEYGNSATCCFKVIVKDSYAPVFLTCPDYVNIYQGQTVSWMQPRVWDNVGIRNLTMTPTIKNGSVWRPGIYIVTYKATDWSGNTNVCSFTVTVYGNSNQNTQEPSTNATHPILTVASSVISILAIVVLILGAVTVRRCRQNTRLRATGRYARRLRTERFFRARTSNTQGHDNAVFTIYDLEPPPYDVAVMDKLPDYFPPDSPPQYHEVAESDAAANSAISDNSVGDSASDQSDTAITTGNNSSVNRSLTVNPNSTQTEV